MKKIQRDSIEQTNELNKEIESINNEMTQKIELMTTEKQKLVVELKTETDNRDKIILDNQKYKTKITDLTNVSNDLRERLATTMTVNKDALTRIERSKCHHST